MDFIETPPAPNYIYYSTPSRAKQDLLNRRTHHRESSEGAPAFLLRAAPQSASTRETLSSRAASFCELEADAKVPHTVPVRFLPRPAIAHPSFPLRVFLLLPVTVKTVIQPELAYTATFSLSPLHLPAFPKLHGRYAVLSRHTYAPLRSEQSGTRIGPPAGPPISPTAGQRSPS